MNFKSKDPRVLLELVTPEGFRLSFNAVETAVYFITTFAYSETPGRYLWDVCTRTNDERQDFRGWKPSQVRTNLNNLL